MNDKKENELYRLIVENSFDSIILTDREGRFLVANRATLESMGLTQEKELLGKRPQDLIDRKVYNNSTIMEAIKTRRPVTGLVNVRGVNRLSTSLPILDEAGQVRYIMTNNRSDATFNEFARQLAYEKEQHSHYRDIAGYLAGRKEDSIIYKSRQMAAIVESCRTLGPTDSAVMLTGESGVGKELVARLLHSMSRRREQAFIPVNCSAIPPDLFESEFFGYEKGAFTGANARGKAGLLQMAGGGTLFLDELGELPLMMQSKLLRFVETGEFYPVGSTRPTRVDVRIISATNRDLLRMMADKTFREDLYYRLHVIPLQIPPLRERPEDVETIAVFFLEKFNKKYEKSLTLSDRELELLRRYRWPGNVRELRNTIERLVLLSDEGRAEQTLRSMLGEAGPLPDASQEPQAARMPEFADWDLPLHQALERFEQIYIRTALKRCGGNMQAAARALGVHRSTLYRKRAEEGEACPPPLTE